MSHFAIVTVLMLGAFSCFIYGCICLAGLSPVTCSMTKCFCQNDVSAFLLVCSIKFFVFCACEWFHNFYSWVFGVVWLSLGLGLSIINVFKSLKCIMDCHRVVSCWHRSVFCEVHHDSFVVLWQCSMLHSSSHFKQAFGFKQLLGLKESFVCRLAFGIAQPECLAGFAVAVVHLQLVRHLAWSHLAQHVSMFGQLYRSRCVAHVHEFK